jgi:hypothetical protein
VAERSHPRWTPIILPDHLHSSRRPRCRQQSRIEQQHKGNAITRSAPPHPTGDGTAPPSLKAPPEPCQHSLGTSGGSDIHVMLAKQFRVTVGQSRSPTKRRSTASQGYPQSVSTVHVSQVQEKWSHSSQQTEPSLPPLWTPVCPVLPAIPHLGGQAGAHRTLADGTDVLTRHLSCGRGLPQVALRVSRPVLCSVAGSSACPSGLLSARRPDPAPGRGSRCTGQLRAAESPQAVGVERHGCHDPPEHGLARRRSQPHACRAPVGQDPARVPSDATFDTDQYVVYAQVTPGAQHQAISK